MRSIPILAATAMLVASCGQQDPEPERGGEQTPEPTMKLEISGGRTIDSPTAGAIREAVLGLDASGDAFLVLGAGKMTYIQCSGDREIGFDLEYQEGSLDRHYRAKETDIDAETIITRFSAYASGDESWRDGVEWEKLDL